MTLIVALECRDGLVMASESQISLTTQGQWTKGEGASKLEVLSHSVMWGGSGHLGTIQRVHSELEKEAAAIAREFNKGREAGARELHGPVNAVQTQVSKELLPSAGETYATGFLFAGYAKDGPFILECDAKGAREFHHVRHFAAIGSGDIFAVHAWRSVAHYDIAAMTLAQAQALAYRTIENAVATAAFGLGGAVQICTATTIKDAHLLSLQEMQVIEDMVKLWKEREIEVLGALGESRGRVEEPKAEAVEIPPTE
jgi:20S proteasome alpha/beta subunit